MGNICAPSKDREAKEGNEGKKGKDGKEMNPSSKQGVTVLTFAGPHDCFDSSTEELPPTFSDPMFWTHNKEMDLKSLPKDPGIAE